MFLLKKTLGVNPVLLLKMSILKYNIPYQIHTKKFGKKIFYYTRFLGYRQQMNQCIRRFVHFVNVLKKRKNIPLWKSLFVFVLNHCIKQKVFVSNKKKGEVRGISVLIRRSIFFSQKVEQVISRFMEKVLEVKKIVQSLNNFYVKLRELVLEYGNVLTRGVLNFYLKDIRWNIYRIISGLRFMFYRNMMPFFHFFFQEKRKFLKLIRRLNRFRRKRMGKNQFASRLVSQSRKDLNTAKTIIKSVVNFRPFFRYQEEIEKNRRLHSRYYVRLRHRQTFLRKSKFGQVRF